MGDTGVRPDVVVVGSGLAGSILARKIAEEKGKKVLVVERREHIGGNVYDYVDQHGIRIQKYGPHTFHTKKKEAYDLLCRYASMDPYRLKCQVMIDGRATPSPFNKTTLFQFFTEDKAEGIYKAMRQEYGENTIYITDLMESNVACIQEYATFLFEKDYRPYTAKQWGIPPQEIDQSVLRRVPVRLSECDTYFEDVYEALPREGFTKMMETMLAHKNIRVQTGTDAIAQITFQKDKGRVLYQKQELPIVYTGAIDELFSYQYGTLFYRSLSFQYLYYERKDYQEAAIVAHPAAEGYTRTTEYTKLPKQEAGERTVVAYEYPVAFVPGETEPYYPVLTQKSRQQYQQYREYARKFSNLYLCGRLADFKYYNMDQVIMRALEVYPLIKL